MPDRLKRISRTADCLTGPSAMPCLTRSETPPGA